MNCTKGTGLKMIEKVLKDRGFDMEKDYLPRLTPESKAVFSKLALSWVEIPLKKEGSPIYEAAQLLYSNGSWQQNLYNFGVANGKDVPFFYQIFLAIPSKEFVLKRVEKMWTTFNDTGRLHVENIAPNGCDFILSDYPQYPDYLRHFLGGWIEGFLSLVKVKITGVKLDERDPKNWTWHVRWA